MANPQSPKIKTINELWKAFEAAAANPSIGVIQRQGMKRCFFAGAISMYSLLVDDISELPDEEAEKAMMSIMKQLQGFNAAVEMGAA